MHPSAPLVDRLHAGISGFVSQCREYLGIGGKVRREPVRDAGELHAFIDSRASFIAQTSLYGYLRTRAGMRYPELFDNDVFVASINIAKWHMWLACVSDLAVYSGGLLVRRGMPEKQAGALMQQLIDRILADTGIPGEADDEFPAHAERVRSRIALTAWQQVEGEGCFHESPAALVQYAPVVENLKQLDEDIVRNSVRYHWQEVRAELRDLLDVEAIARSMAD